MIYWQYNLQDHLEDDGVTSTPAGTFRAETTMLIDEVTMLSSKDGKGNDEPRAQVAGIPYKDYSDYYMDLTQIPHVIVKI